MNEDTLARGPVGIGEPEKSKPATTVALTLQLSKRVHISA